MLSVAAHWESSPYSILLFLVAVAGVIQLFSYAMSRSSKWREYALRFAASNRPEGRAYVVRWASFGKRDNRCKYSYGRCVRVIFTEQGVYFSLGFILGFCHKPFLMPWSKVNRVEKYDGPFYRKYMLLIEEGADEIYLELLNKGGDDLKRFYNKPITAGVPRMELNPQDRPY